MIGNTKEMDAEKTEWKYVPNNHLKFVGHLNLRNRIIQVGLVLGKQFLNFLGHVASSIYQHTKHQLHDNIAAQN